MKVFVRKQPVRLFLKWVQRALFAAAILMLSYAGFVVVDTWIFQKQEDAALARFIPERPADGVPEVAAAGPDGLIGRLAIPGLELSVMVLEGTSHKTLRRAAGHIAGTAFPGQGGNVGIAGHRDTFFRPLRKIRPDDLITLTTLRSEYRYRVVFTKVVSPDNVAMLSSGGSESLTLVTCYPFYFLGPAPDRFIVRATRVTAS